MEIGLGTSFHGFCTEKRGNAVEAQSVGGPKGAAGPAAYVQDLLVLPRSLLFLDFYCSSCLSVHRRHCHGLRKISLSSSDGYDPAIDDPPKIARQDMKADVRPSTNAFEQRRRCDGSPRCNPGEYSEQKKAVPNSAGGYVILGGSSGGSQIPGSKTVQEDQ